MLHILMSLSDVLSAEEAVEFGLADTILEKRPPMLTESSDSRKELS